MPTTRGWTAIGVAGALLVLWLAFGEQELMSTALFLGVAVAAGMVFVRLSSTALEVDRRLHPPAAHEGDTVTIQVNLSARRRMRNVQVEDTVHGLGVARFAAARTVPSDPVVARYEVSCRERGVYAVGPTEVSVTDPLGLVDHRRTAGVVDRLLVYPRIETLRGFPAVRGNDPAVQATRPTYAPRGGDDFFTLREYQIGDDLRKVHWPSTAKRGDIMIKQLEIPWQSRALVLLDARAERYRDDEAFEHAVRGAASAVAHLYRGGFSPDLWTSERAPGARTGNRYRQALEALATIQPLKHVDLRAAVTNMRRRGVGGGALVLVTGQPDDAVLAAYRTLTRDFTRTIVMAVAGPGEALSKLERSAAITVVSTPDLTWARPWKTALERSWSTASAG
ncbi:MAG TPA: DUF58 domain-containing protein [Acidimicrobiia bacterium]|nr:DUF58 domain-containing protein [Acidimicrobiia bacterium]